MSRLSSFAQNAFFAASTATLLRRASSVGRRSSLLVLGNLQQVVHEQVLPQQVEIPLRRVLVLGERRLDAVGDALVDHLQRFALELFPALEREAAQRVDHLALLVHHVVVVEQPLAGLEVLELDALLRLLDRARDERVREHLAFLRAQPIHELAMRSEPNSRIRSSSSDRKNCDAPGSP